MFRYIQSRACEKDTINSVYLSWYQLNIWTVRLAWFRVGCLVRFWDRIPSFSVVIFSTKFQWFWWSGLSKFVELSVLVVIYSSVSIEWLTDGISISSRVLSMKYCPEWHQMKIRQWKHGTWQNNPRNQGIIQFLLDLNGNIMHKSPLNVEQLMYLMKHHRSNDKTTCRKKTVEHITHKHSALSTEA